MPKIAQQALYRTTIVIWTDYDASSVALADLGHDATEGEAYCSQQECVLVDDPQADAHPPSPEFFFEAPAICTACCQPVDEASPWANACSECGGPASEERSDA
jgi:hypothetical protein